MNFTLVNPGDLGYSRIMMQRHLDSKRKPSKENISLNMEPSKLLYKDKSINEGLPRAGQSLLNDSWMTKSAY